MGSHVVVVYNAADKEHHTSSLSSLAWRHNGLDASFEYHTNHPALLCVLCC